LYQNYRFELAWLQLRHRIEVAAVAPDQMRDSRDKVDHHVVDNDKNSEAQESA
jgi:hypothetical protein